ncbi:MAG: hypothetical protein IGR80_13500 [Synechococcales cyanobacterium K44_A2020_017]|nr:hypothetical protein [Synechococcales cyanobacterium K44_A2020_017]
MSVDEILKVAFSTAAAVIASVGGASIIIFGISTWLGKVWAEKVYLKNSSLHSKELEKLKKHYAIELEQLKSEISQRQDFLSTSLSALSSGYISSRERTLVAIEILWKKILEIKAQVSEVTFFYSILLPSEYSEAASNKTTNIIPEINPSKLDDTFAQVSIEVSEMRPFLGESLYRLYYIYRAFAYRQALKVLRRYDKKTIYEWDKNFEGKEDDVMYQALKEVFTGEELQNIIRNSQPFAPVQDILNAIELKIVVEMNEWIFGRQLVNMSIEEQQRILKLYKSILR